MDLDSGWVAFNPNSIIPTCCSLKRAELWPLWYIAFRKMRWRLDSFCLAHASKGLQIWLLPAERRLLGPSNVVPFVGSISKILNSNPKRNYMRRSRYVPSSALAAVRREKMQSTQNRVILSPLRAVCLQDNIAK